MLDIASCRGWRMARCAVALALLGSLFGCGQPAVKDTGPVHIRFSVMGGKEETTLGNNLARAFERQHPEVRVDVEPVAGMGYDMKLTMQSVAGTLPDVVFMADSLVPTFTKYKIVQNLGPYIKSDPTFNQDDIYPQMLDTGRDSKGDLYMLPRELGVVIMFYNRTLFREAGLPDPSPDWTYDDFVRIAKKLTKKDANGRTTQYGFRASYTWPGLYGPLVMAEGGRILSADGKTSMLSSPQALKGLHNLIDLVTVHEVAPLNDPSLGAQGVDPFVQGTVAMTPGVFPAVPNFRQTMTKFDWDVQMLPKGSVKRAVTMGAAGYGMSAGTKHSKEAWQFLKFILSQDGQRVLANSGSGIPALKSLANDPCWRKPGLRPHNLDAFINSLPYGMPWQDTLAFTRAEVADVVNEAFDRSMAKQVTVEDAFREADRKINRIFAEDRENAQ